MQQALMRFDPATGEAKPYPSHAAQWREWHGHRTAWLFNPWTGGRRNAGDVGSDVLGQLICPPGAELVERQKGALMGGSVGGSNAMSAQQSQASFMGALGDGGFARECK